MKTNALAILLMSACLLVAGPVRAATDLRLAPDLSFADDSSGNFPITGNAMDDAKLTSDRATIIFFGTAHCWNTNREAERLVALYPKYRDRIDFVIVDLDHPSVAQRMLIAKYYRGAIPTITVIDRKGEVLYDRAGETASTRRDTSNLESLLKSAR